MRLILRLTTILLFLLPVFSCNEGIKPAPGESVISFAGLIEDGSVAESLWTGWSPSDRIAVKGASSFFITDGKDRIKGAAVPSDMYIAAFPYSSLRLLWQRLC